MNSDDHVVTRRFFTTVKRVFRPHAWSRVATVNINGKNRILPVRLCLREGQEVTVSISYDPPGIESRIKVSRMHWPLITPPWRRVKKSNERVTPRPLGH